MEHQAFKENVAKQRVGDVQRFEEAMNYSKNQIKCL
jgi:hypothetical protein